LDTFPAQSSLSHQLISDELMMAAKCTKINRYKRLISSRRHHTEQVSYSMQNPHSNSPTTKPTRDLTAPDSELFVETFPPAFVEGHSSNLDEIFGVRKLERVPDTGCRVVLAGS